MSLEPRSPHVQSLQLINLIVIQRLFLYYIRYGAKYISVIDPYLKYRSCLNSFEEIKFNRCKLFPQFIH